MPRVHQLLNTPRPLALAGSLAVRSTMSPPDAVTDNCPAVSAICCGNDGTRIHAHRYRMARRYPRVSTHSDRLFNPQRYPAPHRIRHCVRHKTIRQPPSTVRRPINSNVQSYFACQCYRLIVDIFLIRLIVESHRIHRIHACQCYRHIVPP